MKLWRFQKRRGRSSDPAVGRPVRRDSALERAIREDRIDLVFQPQIEPRSGKVVGVEALARWDQTGGADALFDRARAACLAERLSRAIQRRAIVAAARWSGAMASINLSINVLPEDLERAGYDDWLLGEVVHAGLDPRRLTVEIVENALVRDRPAVAERLSRLRASGMRIAVDDFGTGYANLAYLTSLPLDLIKIDRALVADIVGGRRDRIVVRAMIRLARELGLGVIVEGVETEGQLGLVSEWGCDLFQGFLGSGALDEPALRRFVGDCRDAA